MNHQKTINMRSNCQMIKLKLITITYNFINSDQQAVWMIILTPIIFSRNKITLIKVAVIQQYKKILSIVKLQQHTLIIIMIKEIWFLTLKIVALFRLNQGIHLNYNHIANNNQNFTTAMKNFSEFNLKVIRYIQIIYWTTLCNKIFQLKKLNLKILRLKNDKIPLMQD